ncbi:MAG: sugar phosphate isomerase/epimerase [Candidatus Diapherotrites archaeon]
MTQKRDYSIENVYQGGYSSLDPNKAYSTQFLGYRIRPSELGAPTKPDTANQIQQAEQLLNQGIIPIEVGALSPEIFSQIPKQHFKELDRLSKLTGAKISVHAPIVEPSGMGEQGWTEIQRQIAERQLNDAIEKSHELNSNGSVPVTVHSSGIMGSEYAPDKEKGRKIAKLVVVERDSGKPVQIFEEETLHYPGGRVALKKEILDKYERGAISEEQIRGMMPEKKYEKISLEQGRLYTPEMRLNSINHTQWEDSVSQLIFNKERADEILQENQIQIQHLIGDLQKKNLKEEALTPAQKQVYNHIKNAEFYLEDTQQHIESLFNKAWKNTKGDEVSRDILKKASEKYGEELEASSTPMAQSNAMQNLLFNLKKANPKFLVSMEEFALDKSSQTFANVAFNAYNKFGEKGNIPKINIENLPSGMAFSSMEDMKNLILESKHKFAQKLINEKGMGRELAQKKADEIIGMTLDVGHLNISKKQGFTDKDLLKEMEQISKYVKHVHLTDNFGFSDSHLPPGMGNVPFKEILEKLEKAGFKGNKIVEAGGFVQHFQQSPYLPTLEAFGSPIYLDGPTPYWNQSLGFQQGYSSGLGMVLPSNNYQIWGAGISQLPVELGGDIKGVSGRFSQKGME